MFPNLRILRTFFVALNLIIINFASLALADTIPAVDQDFTCINKQTADRYVDQLNIDVQSFGGLELCDSANDTKKLFNDLQILELGQFKTTGNNLLIKGFIRGNNYYQWFVSQTRGINRGDDIPFATAYNSGGYFTMQDGWAILSTLGRVGTIVHEARHTAGYSHTPCTQGPYNRVNVQACDRDYNSGGSHAVEMEYYARVVVQGENFHPLFKTMARLMAMGRSNFVFNQSPIKTRQGLVFLTNQDHLTLMADNQTYNRNLPQNRSGILKRTSLGATLWTPLSLPRSIDLYAAEGGDFNFVDDYSYYKLLRQDRGQGRSSILDFEEVDLGIQRYSVVLNNQMKLSSYDYPNGKWKSFISAPNQSVKFLTTLQNGQEGLFILTQNKEIYEFDPHNMRTKLLISSYNTPFERVAKYNSRIYGISNGELYISEDGQKFEKAQLDSKDVQIYDLTTVPLYDAFEIVN